MRFERSPGSPENVNNLLSNVKKLSSPKARSRYDIAIRVARLSWCPQILDFITNKKLRRPEVRAAANQ